MLPARVERWHRESRLRPGSDPNASGRRQGVGDRSKRPLHDCGLPPVNGFCCRCETVHRGLCACRQRATARPDSIDHRTIRTLAHSVRHLVRSIAPDRPRLARQLLSCRWRGRPRGPAPRSTRSSRSEKRGRLRVLARCGLLLCRARGPQAPRSLTPPADGRRFSSITPTIVCRSTSMGYYVLLFNGN